MKIKKIYNSNNNEIACCFFRSTSQKPNMKILLQITERCNLRCKHCFVSSSTCGNDLSYEDIKNKILPNLIKTKVNRITLTGGEPMVHKDIMKIMNLLNENNMHITLCTNAVALNEKIIEQISKFKDVHVNVSLDGFSSKSHGKFRGNENEIIFNKIIENIKLLSKYKLLNGIMTSPNIYSDVSEYVDICVFAKKYNARYVLFNPLSKFGRGEETQDLGYNQEQLKKLRIVLENENLENDDFEIVFIRIPSNNENMTLSDCNCDIPYIFTNGDVAICPYMVFACDNKESKYDRKDFLYGNILEDNFDLEESMKNYKFVDYVVSDKIHCDNCNKGCKAIKIAHGLSINGCDVEMCKKLKK